MSKKFNWQNILWKNWGTNGQKLLKNWQIIDQKFIKNTLKVPTKKNSNQVKWPIIDHNWTKFSIIDQNQPKNHNKWQKKLNKFSPNNWLDNCLEEFFS